jgi:hypothetical protein
VSQMLSHNEIRALRLMVNELRAEPPPELPWDAMEKRLLAKLTPVPLAALAPLAPSIGERRPTMLRAAPRPSSFSRALGFAAAAAVLALGIGSVAGSGRMPAPAAEAPRPVEAASVALAPGGSGAHDLAELRAGDVIRADDVPVRFSQAGLVAWTLEPGSALRVRSTGMGHTVALERGSIRAEVTPRDPSEGLVEAFAVEVGGTRVAVHGTAFSVTIEGSQAIVDVEHGAVAVGPIGYAGATTGHLLVGPARASFSLDGGRSARLLDRPSQAALAAIAPVPAVEPEARIDRAAPHDQETAPSIEHTAPVAAQAPGLVAAAHASTHPAAGAPPVPAAPQAAPELPRLTVAAVRARLDRCFRQTFEAGSLAPGFSASHTLRIDVKPDGSVLAARFDPPLKPEMTGCAGGAIYGGRFADDAGHLDIPITFKP